MTRTFLSLAAVALIATAASADERAVMQTPAAAQKPAAPALAPNQWQIDPAHSAANFSVRHLMVSTVRGQLGRISGTIEYDGKDVRSVKADVTIDVNGITTQEPKRDAHLRSADFFDAANHPAVTFKSKRAEPAADGAFKLIGDLTIRGTTKEVALDVQPPSPVVKGQRGLVIGTTATTKIKRLEYGLKYNAMVEAGPVVGDDVTITIDLEIGRPSALGTAN
ncbi:MAG TPA: YceI family protein [Vicinamibacterales bacterium]|nr:YceI family protein [Vicinamibacterales bacterium]